MARRSGALAAHVHVSAHVHRRASPRIREWAPRSTGAYRLARRLGESANFEFGNRLAPALRGVRGACGSESVSRVSEQYSR